MSKASKIRWREIDEIKLRKTVNKFNAKIRYHKKRMSAEDAAHLPDTVKLSEARGLIGTRRDFNNLIASLDRFGQRGAETPVETVRGAKITAWDKDEYKRKQQRLNRKRKKRKHHIEELEAKTRGKALGYKLGDKIGMGSTHANAEQPLKRTVDDYTNAEWEKARKAIDKELSDAKTLEAKERMRENYLHGLATNNIPQEIFDLVNSVDIDEFADTVISDQEAEFSFVYSDEEYNTKVQALIEVWKAAAHRSKTKIGNKTYFTFSND